VHMPVPSPTSSAFPKSRPWVGFPESPRKETSCGLFRDRRYSLRSGLLVCSPPRSPLPVLLQGAGQPWLFHASRPRIVTVACIGHASRL